MSPIKTSYGRLPGRVAASNTIERPAAQLDAQSLVALEFCTFWLQRHASIKAPASVVMRRALALLADHLSHSDGNDIGVEARLVRDAGTGRGSATSLTQARARIEEHLRAPGAQPMGHWFDALHSIEERRESRRMLDKLEELMGDSA